MPRRLAFESRPFLTDPWPFLCAMTGSLRNGRMSQGLCIVKGACDVTRATRKGGGEDEVVNCADRESSNIPPAWPWTVWRIDDNGSTFVVRAGLSREEAERLVAEFTTRGHKQTYWAESERSGEPA